MKARTRTGALLRLEEPPLGKGGEGSIHRIAGRPGEVAKLYLDPADAAKRREKIEAMASIGDGVVRRFDPGTVAWPLEALYADDGSGRFVGFTMPEVPTPIAIDALYEYPPAPDANFSMRDKLGVAQAVADLTDAAHRAGQVIGDYNDNNVPVLPGCRAALVDVDSFHATVGGRTFPCTVCMPGYAAPEVLRNMRGSASFEACAKPTFTQRTDDWALAVHVFRMLFNGAHPYHCVPLPKANGSLPAVLPVDKRVERGETPFFARVPGAKLPPFAPDVALLPSYLRELFERAFVAGHADPDARPSAAEWSRALARYRAGVRQCGRNEAHWYGAHLDACPYCEADERAGRALARSGLLRAPSPLPAPPAPALPASAAACAALPAARAFSSRRLSRRGFTALSVLVGAAVGTGLVLLTPLPCLLFAALLGSWEPWMQMAAVGAGAAGSWAYAGRAARSDSWASGLLAAAAAVCGIVVAALALALLFALVGFVMEALSGILMGAFLLAILAGLLNG
ncbi:hypothetical protein [Arabiibacter massiliensis]|uniref:hypothetical protein n=1 Tax=Arabiibacter massiliensis TaxID=1870985 RepID=UPI0009B944F6|nr:hypothetical protein [Arabiibacter massiliensis]